MDNRESLWGSYFLRSMPSLQHKNEGWEGAIREKVQTRALI